MESIDWNKIFELAKKHIPGSGIMRAGRGGGIKRAGKGGAKKASVKGGARIYPCWMCIAFGYKGLNRSTERLKTHLEENHHIPKENVKAIEEQWRKDNNVESKNPEYAEAEMTRSRLPLGKYITLKTLHDVIDSGEANKDQIAVLNSINKALGTEEEKEEKKDGEEKKEEPVVPAPVPVPAPIPAPVPVPAPPIPRRPRRPHGETAAQAKERLRREKSIKETVDKVNQKEAKRVKEMLEAYNKPKAEPGIKDIMSLMKAQKGELPPEQRTDLATMGKETVKRIRARSTKSKATKADQSNIDAKMKTLAKSKLKRVSAKDIKVVSKITGKGKPVLLISD